MVLHRTKNLFIELAWTLNSLKNRLDDATREDLEDLAVYLCLELEKRARYTHYYELEKPKLKHFWQRAAAQFRIGHKVADELRRGRENPAWVHDRIAYWSGYVQDWVEDHPEVLSKAKARK